ncbi:MAG: PhoP regulatory network YrbL family protein [Alphaproteobacteria bacterium]|nr:PhoP regulatory network YrbL family protein [Alphaproteobacteria bacterium]
MHSLKKLKKREIADAFKYIPMFYGTIETNKGLGSVFEFIQGENLETYLNKHGFDSDIEKELNNIRDNFIKNKLHFSDCRAENFVIQNNKDRINIYAIDGFEHNELIPITKINFFSKQKVKRIFKRFINQVKQ